MPASDSLPIIKMHGAGNDYVYIDERASGVLEDRYDVPALARAIADRHFGVGGDGLILVREAGDGTAAGRMQMFNADGSESEMCGNGLRCVAKLLHDVWHADSPARSPLTIETGNGPLTVDIVESNDGTQVRVDMGPPICEPARIPTTLPATSPSGAPVNVPLEVDTSDLPELAGWDARVTSVSMGNPHAVLFFDDAEAITDRVVHTLGPRIENHAAFPNRVNVEFVTTPSRGEFTQRTWERGSGETLACGTGACAVMVAGVLNDRLDASALGQLRGGGLQLEWAGDASNPAPSVFMTGGAKVVFEGRYPVPSDVPRVNA